jgi:ferrous iron transport protein A
VTTLDQVPTGGRCRIESISGPPALTQRLFEFGLMDGEEVCVLARAPLGDPIEIESPLSRVSLRRSEAAQIQVTPLG